MEGMKERESMTLPDDEKHTQARMALMDLLIAAKDGPVDYEPIDKAEEIVRNRLNECWHERSKQRERLKEAFEAARERERGYHSWDPNSGYSSCDAEMRGTRYEPGSLIYDTFEDWEKQ